MIATATTRLISCLLLLISVVAGVQASMVGASLPEGTKAWYDIEVLVDDSTPGTRNKAIRTALEQVLSENPQLAPAEPMRLTQVLAESGNYVQRYKYLRPGSVDPAQPELAREHLTLWIRFDGFALSRALAPPPPPEPATPAAGASGPFPEHIELLLWLAVQDGRDHYLMSEERRDNAIGTELRTIASAHGVNLLYPLMDLEDQRRIAFKDVWGGYTDRIATASDRYGVPDRLIGRIYRDTGADQWNGDWLLLRHGQDEQWRSDAGSLNALLSDTLRRISGREPDARFDMRPDGAMPMERAPVIENETRPSIRADVAPMPASRSRELKLTVDGVRSITDYARVSEYLKSLGLVRSSSVMEIAENHVDFMLELGGDPEQLRAELINGGVIEPAEDGALGHYRLRP